MGFVGPLARANDDRTSVSAGSCGLAVSIGGVIVRYNMTRLRTLPCGLDGFVAALHYQLTGGHLAYRLLKSMKRARRLGYATGLCYNA